MYMYVLSHLLSFHIHQGWESLFLKCNESNYYYHVLAYFCALHGFPLQVLIKCNRLNLIITLEMEWITLPITLPVKSKSTFTCSTSSCGNLSRPEQTNHVQQEKVTNGKYSTDWRAAQLILSNKISLKSKWPTFVLCNAPCDSLH